MSPRPQKICFGRKGLGETGTPECGLGATALKSREALPRGPTFKQVLADAAGARGDALGMRHHTATAAIDDVG